MATTRITGKSAVITFNGTDISADYRSFDVSEEVKLVDLTAGDDDAAVYGLAVKDGKASYKGLYDSGTFTTVWGAVASGTEGDLVWYPEGNTTGKPYYTVNAIVQSRSKSIPFDGAVEISVEFQFSGEIPAEATVA